MGTPPSRRNSANRVGASSEGEPAGWDSLEQFERVADGRESAADDVFHHYVQRLVLLARRRMSQKLATRLDPEDVVMSAYRSFFVRARGGKFQIEHSGDLWRLLVEITCHKLYRQAAHHRAQKRSMDRESATPAAPERLVSERPSPDMAALVADEVEQVMAGLNDVGRRVFQLRLQDYTAQEIAAELEVTERTVRRHLAQVRAKLAERNDAGDPSSFEGKVVDQNVAKSNSPATVASDSTLVSKSVAPLQRFSDYKLLQQIGFGATGKVYRARHQSTEELFAIKYLRKELSQDARVIERFDREVEILTSLHHPAVVRIAGHGATPSGGRFLVMQLVDGGDLQTQLEQGPVAIDKAIAWIVQACAGIAAANESGIVHCDLKPANLLLRDGTDVVVTDFGLARDVRNSAAPVFAGTPAFMAPEQIDWFYGPIDERTDVYGLGMCLFALLTGRAAFVCKDASELVAEIVSGRPAPDLCDLRTGVSSSLAVTCLRAIAKRPDARFDSAKDFGSALKSL